MLHKCDFMHYSIPRVGLNGLGGSVIILFEITMFNYQLFLNSLYLQLEIAYVY